MSNDVILALLIISVFLVSDFRIWKLRQRVTQLEQQVQRLEGR